MPTSEVLYFIPGVYILGKSGSTSGTLQLLYFYAVHIYTDIKVKVCIYVSPYLYIRTGEKRNNFNRTMMNIEEIKKISLVDYLQSLGCSPVSCKGNSYWYKSPFRNETEASFKVNVVMNKWYDFALGKGGNIIALAEELYQSNNIPYLLKRIEERVPYIRPATFSFGRQKSSEPCFKNLKVKALEAPVLLSYLKERSIDIGIAQTECKELRFSHNGKNYFAIGFPNRSGGYEVRNCYFKGCVAPKDITHIRQQGKQTMECCLFEGFMDYLSYLTMRMKESATHTEFTHSDYMVLNSVSNMDKAIEFLEPYSRISCFLDNDKAGKEAFQKLKSRFGERVNDMSLHYSGCKDLNDFLCKKPLDVSLKQEQTSGQVQSVSRMQEPEPKKKRGFRL